MVIKLSLLHSLLHENETFNAINEAFINNIEEKIGQKIIVAPLDDYDCDLKLIFIESGGSEGLFLQAFNDLKEPYYLLTTGKNNSLAASIEILTYLNNNDLSGEIIHGSIDYISNRIKELSNKKTIKEKRLGVIGKPSDWLIASIPNYDKVFQTFNYNLIDIPLSLVEKYYQEANLLDFDKNILLEFDVEEINKAKRIYLAIKRIKDEYNLDGLTIRCFDLLKSLKTTSCLALAILNTDGVMSACEGDIMSLISMQLIKDITNEVSFQANPSRIDIDKNEIVFAHCTIPFNMLSDYHLMTHYESNMGVAIKGELKNDDVTIVRISKNLKDYFISEGKIIENLNETNLCRTQIKIKMDDVLPLLTRPCGNHHIIVYGKHKQEINDVLTKILN